MSIIESFRNSPEQAAKWMHKDGQGAESNPYPYDTKAHKTFNDKIERLELEEQQREAQS